MKTATTPEPSSSRRRMSPAAIAWAPLGALVIFLSLIAPGAAAQSKPFEKPYALIFGTVWNKAGVPIHGVPVKIRRADEKKARWELVSDHSGEFAQRVPAGTADYIVWADIKKPKGKPRDEIKVHIENDERTDIALHLTE